MCSRVSQIATAMALLTLAASFDVAIGSTSGEDYSLTLVGTYTPEGLSTPVDVYKLTVYNNKYPGAGIGAIDLTVGSTDLWGNPVFPNIYGTGAHLGSGPFQAAVSTSRGPYLTPSMETAAALGTDTEAYKADTHFLMPSDWLSLFPQSEANDLSLGGTAEVQYGLGSIVVIAAPPPDLYVDELDVMLVGVLRGTDVWADLGTWEKPHGRPLHLKVAQGGELAAIHLPGPSTFVLLAAGVLGALARRRYRLQIGH